MKKLTFVMWLVLMLMWGCAKTPVYKSTWQQPSFKLDGEDQDWEGKMYYDSESDFIFGLANDQEKLFVKLKISNQLIQQKILVTGLTFWIDTVGKRKKQLGLTFPMKSNPKGMVGGGSRRNRNLNVGQGSQKHMDIVNFNMKYKTGMESMLLINYFGDERIDFTNNKNVEGINAILRYDKDLMLYYEAEIPLSKIFPNPQKFLNDTTETFSFGFETGKLEMPAMGSQAKGGRGGIKGGEMSPIGRGGQRGGGGQQMGSEQMAEVQAMAEPNIVWIKKARLEYQSN